MFSCVYGLLGSYRKEGSMCFIGLIGKEQLPCCISTIFLSSTALAGSLCSQRCPPCAILSAEDEERASVHACVRVPVFVCARAAIMERCEHRHIVARQLNQILSVKRNVKKM